MTINKIQLVSIIYIITFIIPNLTKKPKTYLLKIKSYTSTLQKEFTFVISRNFVFNNLTTDL